jgi:MscS family membrane protein
MVVQDFFQRVFLGNTIAAYCWFVGIILAGLIFKKMLSKFLTFFVFKFLQKYSTGVGYDKLLILLKKPLGVFILIISFYLAANVLEFPVEWNFVSIDHFGLRMILYRSFQIGIIFSLTWVFLRIIDFFGLILMYRASLTESKADDQLVPFVKESVKVIVCIFALFFMFGTVFKLNVASLIAGLGIGGLAIALAAKESLENLMGSFTIFLDKPFTIGDLIKVGNVEGVVEKIGFRSTRIRTLEKSYVTVPNKKMVDSELDNLSLRIQRRSKFSIGLTYQTKPSQIKSIIKEIENFINNHSSVIKDETRIHLFEFDNSSLNIQILYFVDTLEYDIYLNVRQEINYAIIEIVERNGSEFAYPSTSVYMKK